MSQTKKKCARKGKGCAKMEKDVPKWKNGHFLRLGREEEGEMDFFEITNRRN